MLRSCLLFCVFLSPLLAAKPSVLVTILPYKYLVERVAEGCVSVDVLVPPGADPHSFEPTARQALRTTRSKIWFRIGEPVEERVAKVFQSHFPEIQFVDLRQGLTLLPAAEAGLGKCSHFECYDPHIWLSPKLLITQVKRIADELQSICPNRIDHIKGARDAFIEELTLLDAEITGILRPLNNRMILVAHPAYGYFCRDYDLKQIAIEQEGKEPSPQQLTNLLYIARQNRIKNIFIQRDHPSKGSRLLAQQLGASLVIYDPLSENFLKNMRTFAKRIAGSE